MQPVPGQVAWLCSYFEGADALTVARVSRANKRGAGFFAWVAAPPPTPGVVDAPDSPEWVVEVKPLRCQYCGRAGGPEHEAKCARRAQDSVSSGRGETSILRCFEKLEQRRSAPCWWTGS